MYGTHSCRISLNLRCLYDEPGRYPVGPEKPAPYPPERVPLPSGVPRPGGGTVPGRYPVGTRYPVKMKMTTETDTVVAETTEMKWNK